VPRKPKTEKKTVVVKVNETPVTVVLHPPAGKRKSWYAYTAGWVASRSTGQADFGEAVKATEAMLRGGGAKPQLNDAVLSDEDLEAIQRTHFLKKTAPAKRPPGGEVLRGVPTGRGRLPHDHGGRADHAGDQGGL
jgi:hypothetical protein